MDYPMFIGGSAQAQSPMADGSRTVNFYVERTDSPGAPAAMALYPVPGVERVATAADLPGRGLFTCASRMFAVLGSTFYEFDPATETLTARGTVAADSNPATFAYNGDGGGEVLVSSGGNGYLFTLATNAFALVRTGATTMVAHLDGYFIALDAATSTFYLSNLLDGTTWDPTQFAQRSVASDPWVSMAVLDRYLWLLGSETSEIWFDAGTFPFPFEVHPSGLVPWGCGAPFSPRVVAGTLLWLGRTKDGAETVLQAQGFTPSPVSSFAVASALGRYSRVTDAIGDSYQQLGHTFYVLTLPTAQATWAYDVTPGVELPPALRWAERGTWVAEDNEYEAWRPLYHVYVGTTHYVLDRSGEGLYTLRDTVYTDVEDRPIRRLRRPPSLFQGNQRVRVFEFQLLLEAGLGTGTGQGANPTVALRVSSDGGQTWGVERTKTAGAQGQYHARVIWLQCGMGRRWVPEVVMTDPAPWRLLGATMRAEVEDGQQGGLR